METYYNFQEPMIFSNLLDNLQAYYEKKKMPDSDLSMRDQATKEPNAEPELLFEDADYRVDENTSFIDRYTAGLKAVMNAYYISENLSIDLGKLSADKIKGMYKKRLTKVTRNDVYVLKSLIFMAGMLHKYDVTKGWYEINYTERLEGADNFSNKIKPDLLELYKLFMQDNKLKNYGIAITYMGKDIKLHNDNNWFLNLLFPFLDEHLDISGLAHVKSELQKIKNAPKRVGRPPRQVIYNWILLGTYHLLQHSSVSKRATKNNDGKYGFLLEFLTYLNLASNKTTDILKQNIKDLKEDGFHFNPIKKPISFHYAENFLNWHKSTTP